MKATTFQSRALPMRMPFFQPGLFAALESASIVGVFRGASTAREPDLHKGNVRDLFKLYAEGKIRPRISARYKLADGGKAIRALSSRAATGKLVVVME
jgi:NADPH2:quinone reductase